MFLIKKTPMIDCRFERKLIKYYSILFSLQHCKCKNSKYTNHRGKKRQYVLPQAILKGVCKQVFTLNVEVPFT